MSDVSTSFDSCIEHAEATDIGMRRKNNQDALNTMVSPDETYWEQRGHLFIVADGMGAHAAGELASKLAADGIAHTYAKRTELEPAEALRQAILDANDKIHRKGRGDSDFQGMGTTCSALVLLAEGAVVGHVGDSRVYRLRGHQLDQLTFDHSLVWEMRAAGQVNAAAAEIHLPKNIITRSLGPNATVQVDLEGPFPVHRGDTFLLCSDGLTGAVEDDELAVILQCLPPSEAARTLTDIANLRGGPDNITVIVVRVNAPPVAQADFDSEPEPVAGPHRMLWIVAALCLAAAVGLLVAQAKLPAVLCAVGGAVAIIVALLQRFDRDDPTVLRQPRTAMGRGPYVSCESLPDAALVARFNIMVAELSSAAESAGGDADWQPFDQLTGEAAEATEREDFDAAIYAQSRAISFAVDLLKRRNARHRPSDSSVDLF